MRLLEIRFRPSSRATTRLIARPRRGFTLVELLVSLLAINVALLALVAGGAGVMKRTSELRVRNAAVEAAANRLQQLAAGPCAPAAGTAVGRAGVVEHWTALAQRNGIQELSDSVTFTLSGAAHSLVVRTRLPC